MARTEVTGTQIRDGSVDLTVDVTGILPVGNGGTGSNTLALNNVLLGNGTGALQAVAPGASGNVLTSNGTSWVSSPVGGGEVTLTGTQTLTNKTLTTPTITTPTVKDATGANFLTFSPATTPVNYLMVGNREAGNAPSISAVGTDTNIDLSLVPKGTGRVRIQNGLQSGGSGGTLSLPTTADTLVGRATTDTLTNKTISGASNTITSLPSSSMPDASRKVANLLVSVANNWTKVATFSPGSNPYYAQVLKLQFVALVYGGVSIANANIHMGNEAAAANPRVAVRLTERIGNFADDFLKVVSGAYGTDIEVWIKFPSSGNPINVYELARYNNLGTLTYHSSIAWQATEPVGAVNNVKSAGLELTSPRVNQINDTNGLQALSIFPRASAVNAGQIIPGSTGGSVSYGAIGESNIDVALRPAGTGSAWMFDSNAVGVLRASNLGRVSPVNHWHLVSNVTGGAVEAYAAGSDANIDIDLRPKGTGVVEASGVPVVTTTGAQTLTNKTLTSPTITGTPVTTALASGVQSGNKTAVAGLINTDFDSPNPSFIPELHNKLVSNVARGGTLSVTKNDVPVAVTNPDWIFDGPAVETAGTYAFQATSTVNTDVFVFTVGLNSTIQAIYSVVFGIQFAGPWGGRDVKIEAFFSGTWNTIYDVVNAASGSTIDSNHWIRYTGHGANRITEIRFTVTDLSSLFRVNRLFFGGPASKTTPWLKSSGGDLYGTAASAPTLQAAGGDANIDLDLRSKGTGVVEANGVPVVTTTGAQTLASKTLSQPAIVDSLGNNVVGIIQRANAVNYLQFRATEATGSPAIFAAGADTNVGFTFVPKGSGTVQIYTATESSSTIQATGAGTTIDLNLVSKGSGVVEANGVPVVTTTGTQTLTNKSLTSPAITTPTGIVKGDVGLGSVDNTADANKAVLSATKLTTARTINGVSFDGTTNITVADSTKQATSEKGQANGYASLDSGGKVPVAQLPNSIMEYQGTWNASTNTPTLANGTGSPGDVYRVSVAGTSLSLTFEVGDYIIYSGTTWEKSDTTDAVASVAGKTGNVTLTSTDVGLGNVDNTSNATERAATATLTNKTIQLVRPDSIYSTDGSLVNTFYIGGSDSGRYPYFSPAPKYLWHDILRFSRFISAPTYETYNGTAWSSQTLNTDIFSGKEATAYALTNGTTTTGARWTWSSGNLAYSYLRWWVIGLGYVGATTPINSFLVESSADGTTWTTRHTSTVTYQAAPVWLYASDHGGHTYLRLSIVTTNAQAISMSGIKGLSSRWANQGGGVEYEFPYDWDGSRNITTLANLKVGIPGTTAGSAVTIDATQTLTNKTIALGSNTVSGTLAQFNTAVTDADLARTDAAQTFTGVQTMTSPALTTPAITGAITGTYSFGGTPTWPTFNQNTTGSAATLTTARTINGVSFNGSANITVADATKEPIITAGTTAQYYRGDKTFQTLDKAAVGLGNVDNTTDANKPVSTATSTALSGKEPTITAGTTAQYWRGDKSFQTLNQDAVPSGTTNKVFTATQETKLAGIATGATANSTDATLLARANHTGTQTASTISDFNTAADARLSAATHAATLKTALAAADEFMVLDSEASFGLKRTTWQNQVDILGALFSSATMTFTAKRVTPRVKPVTSAATPAINTDEGDVFLLTSLATNVTSMTTSLTGTPTDGQKMIIRIKSAAAQTIAWGASFISSGVATLPTLTVAGKTHTVGFIWDAALSDWVCMAVDGVGY